MMTEPPASWSAATAHLSVALLLIAALVLTGVVLAVSRLTGGSDANPPYSDVYGAAISTVPTQSEPTQPEPTQPELSPTYPNYATDSAYPTEVDSSSATSGGYPPPTPDLSTEPSSAPVSGPPAEASADSWVVQLASIGAATSPSEVERRRSAAEARLGLPVYVLDSSDFASLRPGYFVLY